MLNSKAIRAELIRWLAKYDATLKNGNPPMVSDTIDEIIGILYKQVDNKGK